MTEDETDTAPSLVFCQIKLNTGHCHPRNGFSKMTSHV